MTLRCRKRTLLMVLLLLTYSVGGAIINVAVAWGCERWCASPHVNPDWGSSGSVGDDEKEYLLELGWRATPQQGPIVCTLQKSADFQRAVLRQWWFERQEIDPNYHDVVDTFLVSRRAMQRHVAGWPLRSLTGTAWNSAPLDARQIVEDWHPVDAIIIHHPMMRFGWTSQLLPLKPLWPGFAIDSIFYAAILWLLVVIPGFVRRRIRVRRGLCPACAYPVGSSGVCTECGNTVSSIGVKPST